MALVKDFTTDYGVTVSYWKVVSLSLDWLTKRGRIKLVGYVDEVMRTDGKVFLQEKYFDIIPLNFEQYFGAESLDYVNPVSQAYIFIKDKDSFFSDAIDN